MSERNDSFLALWRQIALATVTFLIAFTVLIDNLGRLFIDEHFHVSEVIFATLVSSWTILLGVETWARIRRGNGNGSP